MCFTFEEGGPLQARTIPSFPSFKKGSRMNSKSGFEQILEAV